MSTDPPSACIEGKALWFPSPVGAGFYVECTVPLPIQQTAPQITVFIVDYSGSMEGHVRQAQVALKLIEQGMTDDQQKRTYVIAYNTRAFVYTLKEYNNRAGGLQPAGVTNFIAAFEQMTQLITHDSKSSFTFIFMTDGSFNASKFYSMDKKWTSEQHAEHANTLLRSQMGTFTLIANLATTKTHRSVIVHAIGYGNPADLDPDFLKKLVHAGQQEGMFRLIEGARLTPENGFSVSQQDSKSSVLTEAFQDMFELSHSHLSCQVGWSTHTAKVSFYREPEQKVWRGCFLTPHPLHKEQVEESGEGEQKDEPLYLQWKGAFTDTQPVSVQAVLSPTPLAHVSPTLKVSALELIDPRTSEEVASLMQALAKITTKGCKSNVERVELETQRKTLYDRWLEMLHKTNELTRGATSQGAQELKMESMRYEAQFSKARRTRMMALRTHSNLHLYQQVDEKLQELKQGLTPDVVEALATLSEEGAGWSCLHSMDTLHEIMTQTTDDFLCVGIRVKRDESIVDSPSTGLRLEATSQTIVSYHTFVEGMKRAIEERGAKGAHGGFRKKGEVVEIGADGEEDDGEVYCLVGQHREKINAVIPLWIHPAHGARILASSQLWIGYLYALDPLAYDKHQSAAIANLLVHMYLQGDTSERGQILRGELLPLAKALFHTPDYQSALRVRYEKFIEDLHRRNKQDMNHLPLVLSYAYLLDLTMGGETHIHLTHLRQTFIPLWCEYIKREVRDRVGHTEIEAHARVKRLLYGPSASEKARLQEVKDEMVPLYPLPTIQGQMQLETQVPRLQEVKDDMAPLYPLPMIQCRMQTETQVPSTISTFVRTHQIFAEAFLTDSQTNGMDTLVELDKKSTLEEETKEQTGVLSMEQLRVEMEELKQQHSFDLPPFVKFFVQGICTQEKRVLEFPECLQLSDFFRLRHFLLAYFYYNESVPDSMDVERIMSHCHDFFTEKKKLKTKGDVVATHRALALERLGDALDYMDTHPALFYGLLTQLCPQRVGTLFDEVVELLLRKSRRDIFTALLTNRVVLHGQEYRVYRRLAHIWLPARRIMIQIKPLVGLPMILQIQADHVKNNMKVGHSYRYPPLNNRHGWGYDHPNPDLIYPFKEYEGLRG